MKDIREGVLGCLHSSKPDVICCLCEMGINSQPALHFLNEPLLFHILAMFKDNSIFSSVYSNRYRILLCLGRNLRIVGAQILGWPD